MARQRSPNYPSVDLGGAVESAKALYKREGRTAVPTEVAVRAWGFTTLSGNARSRLAGVRQYGLIENDRQGNIRLSDRGLTLAVADSSSHEYSAALQEAALTPDIFRELNEAWRQASDEALRHHLIIGRKFSDYGARRLITAFRSTIAVANLDNPSYSQDNQDMEALVSETSDNQGGGASNGSRAGERQDNHTVEKQARSEAEDFYRWPLYDVVAEVAFHGGAFTPDDIELLQEYLNTVKKSRSRAMQSNPAPTHGISAKEETNRADNE